MRNRASHLLCSQNIIILILFNKLIFKILRKSHVVTRFYYCHSGYSIEVSPSPHDPPPQQTHKMTHTHTHRPIRSVPLIIHSNFQNSFTCDVKYAAFTYLMYIMLVHNTIIYNIHVPFFFSSRHAQPIANF